jgi:hypothetical protein
MYCTRYSRQILMKLEFYRSLKNSQISNFVKIRTVGAELFHADKQTVDGRMDRHDEVNNRSSH